MAEQASGRQPIIYVVGLNNSGSTWLSLLLGQMTGTTNIGEVWHSLHTSEDESQNRHACTCGAMMSECEFWGPIMKERSRIKDTDALHARVLEVFRERFPGRVMIDSSKRHVTLNKGWLADRNKDDVDIKFVHIVRDYRGWSSKRKKMYEQRGHHRPLIMHCLRWFFRTKARENFIRKTGRPVLTVAYESLVFNFESELKRITEFVGLEMPENWREVNPDSLSLHMARGNKVRHDLSRYANIRYHIQWTLDSRFVLLGPLLYPLHRYWKKIYTNK